MIDTHSHLDADEFDEDRLEVIERAFDGGIEAVIIPAIEAARFEKVMRTVELHNNLYFGIGVHPHSASKAPVSVLNEVYDLAQSQEKAVAIGEIGLDYYYDFAPKDVQKKVFREQLEIAKSLDLPVIVHNRESDSDVLEIITEAQDGTLRGVLHCFSGDLDFLEKVMNLNFLVSFTGNVTFGKFVATETVRKVANDRFMIETDAPYMTPKPYRGKRNEPSYVKYVAQKISEIKNIELNEVIQMTNNNAKKLFGILSIILMMALFPFNSYSQNRGATDYDDQYYDDYEEVDYNKTFGFGPVIGTNTIVQTVTPNKSSVSYEGLIAYGGTIHYSPANYLILSGSFLYSKNTKIQEQFLDLEANTHRQLELTANFIVNPHGVINLYGFVGPSYLMNTYGVPGGGTEDGNRFGINTGLGFFFNIPVSDAGLLAVSAEWKLDFMFGTQHFDFDTRLGAGKQDNNPVEITTFFSIPRLNIVFYPDLF